MGLWDYEATRLWGYGATRHCVDRRRSAPPARWRLVQRSMQASTRTEHRLGVIRIQDELPNFARHLSTCRMGGDELAGNLKFAT